MFSTLTRTIGAVNASICNLSAKDLPCESFKPEGVFGEGGGAAAQGDGSSEQFSGDGLGITRNDCRRAVCILVLYPGVVLRGLKVGGASGLGWSIRYFGTVTGEVTGLFFGLYGTEQIGDSAA